MNKTIWIGLCILMLLSGCVGTTDSDITTDTIEIYILRATDEPGTYVRDLYPVIQSEDIVSYNQVTNEMVLSECCLDRLKGMNQTSTGDNFKEMSIEGYGAYKLGAIYPDKYAVVVNNEEIFSGWFEPPIFISFYPSGVVIADTEDGIILKQNIFEPDVKDVRGDQRLINALASNGLLLQ